MREAGIDLEVSTVVGPKFSDGVVRYDCRSAYEPRPGKRLPGSMCGRRWKPAPVTGKPDARHMSTSYLEATTSLCV